MLSFKGIDEILASQPFSSSSSAEYSKKERVNFGIGPNFSFSFDHKNSTYFNIDPAFQDILGFQLNVLEDEGAGLFNRIIHKEDMESVISLLHKGWYFILSQPGTYKQDYNMSIDYRLSHLSGKYLHFIQHLDFLVTDDRGNIRYSNCTFHDITHWNKSSIPDLNIYYKNKLLRRWQYTPVQTKPSISKREREIVQLICSGKTSSEVADILCVSKYTVDTHRKSIMKKLGVRGIPALLHAVNQRQLI